MYPYIFVLGREYPSYGLMVITGYIFSMGFALFNCRRKRLPVVDGLYFFAFVMVFAAVGAKILYITANLKWYTENLNIIFESFASLRYYLGAGFVFYGGLIGGCIGAIAYSHYFSINGTKIAECFVPGIPLFHFFGRIGCFLAGCCYGIEYEGIFSVVYTNSLGAPNGSAYLPVQLIEAGFNLIIFLLLIITEKRLKKPLQNFGLYGLLYGVLRFVLEFFRGDSERGVFGIFSTSQWISLFIIPFGLYMLFSKPENNPVIKTLMNGKADSH
ncbi:MAG: prolipoprotein diacylglyceryl transferase [Clostridiales bacterium]|nr:prolipoprotein diacylglyceryl transferase [Clostridiales bacterium]